MMSENNKKMRKARKDRLAATPSKPSERIVGSSKNRRGSASSVSSAKDIDLSQDIVRALQVKVRIHNKKMSELNRPSHAMASVSTLKAVFRRGAGAYSSSHRPGMSRNQWSYGRVNAFLKMLDKGKPTNLRYVGDSDLLPEGHPWKRKSSKSDQIQDVKALGRKLRRISRNTEPYDPNPIDGDLDGVVQEGTAFERPSTPRVIPSSVRPRRISGSLTVEDIAQLRRGTRTTPQPKTTAQAIKRIEDPKLKKWVSEAIDQGFTITHSQKGEVWMHSPYIDTPWIFSGKPGDSRKLKNIERQFAQIGFVSSERLESLTAGRLEKVFGFRSPKEILSATPDEMRASLRRIDNPNGADALSPEQQKAQTSKLYEIINDLRAFLDPGTGQLNLPEDIGSFSNLAVLYNLNESMKNELRSLVAQSFGDEIATRFEDEDLREPRKNSNISGSMSKRRIAGAMSVTPPPSPDQDPWDDALERLVEDEYERAYEELIDSVEQSAKDDESFFDDAINSYDIWKDSPFANPTWIESEWIEDQPSRYAPEPPELKDPDSIDWDKMLAAIDSDLDDDDRTWDDISEEIDTSQEKRKQLRSTWSGKSKASQQKRADLWNQFTSEDVWLQELADEYSTPRSILRSALLKAGQESGMDKDDVERAINAAERSWIKRRDAYEVNKANAEIDAEIDALGATVPRSIKAIDEKIRRLNRKLDRVKNARNQASAEYQASRRAYTRAMVLGSWLYDTKPVRRDDESSEDFAFRMYQWAVDTNPTFMKLIQQLDEYAEVGSGTRGLFHGLDTKVGRLRDEKTKLEEMRKRAEERADGAVRALLPTEYRKAIQARKAQDQALLDNPMYRRFISGAMSTRNYSSKPMASTARTRTSSITPVEISALAYLDKIGGSVPKGSIVTPSGRRPSGSMQAQPSYKLNDMLDVPKRMPSTFSETNYQSGLHTMGKYGAGGRKVTDSRYNNVWLKIMRGVTDYVTKKRDSTDPTTLRKRAIVIGGAPGSGKTTQRLNGFDGRIPSRREAAHVDIDEMKQLIPEYNGYLSRGSSSAAGATHTESQNIAFAVISEAIRKELDVVFDSSGQFNNDPDTLGKLSRAGYKIEAHYFVGDRDVLLSRIRNRAQETGRSVPEEYVDIIQANLRNIMAMEMSNFNEFSLWSNDSDGAPVLLARKAMSPDGNWVVEIFDDRTKQYLSTSNLNTTMRIGEEP